ncbi:hypothetical protein IAQ61_002231 [Plenodomus lingam]|uniref:uncharacterized protein n=1 Tax=Leptosphaeria maculans TaxID=5022 RepID=UPI003316A60C|nr:hypothetical protein IAQ61_002231 [Plenodomus lingam]
MRAALRLLASVKPGQFLEVGAPTGLCGLLTHPSPRSALLYHYTSTLDKLKQIPESSVYRQSTEALTKHRLQIIEKSEPQGWKEWQDRVRMLIDEDITNYSIIETSSGQTVVLKSQREVDERDKAAEWDGEKVRTFPEGIRTVKERQADVKRMKGDATYTPERAISTAKIPPEPQYTAEAISDLESQLGAGLLEEVIQVAEGEHKLVDTMIAAKVWEPLVEEAPPAQWEYHERATHTKTQKP